MRDAAGHSDVVHDAVWCAAGKDDDGSSSEESLDSCRSRRAAVRGMPRMLPQGLPPASPRPNTANRTLLLGGRRDGHICVFNMTTGKVEFEIEVRI